jgi:hypothetical protein
MCGLGFCGAEKPGITTRFGKSCQSTRRTRKHGFLRNQLVDNFFQNR